MLTDLTQSERLDLAWMYPVFLVQIELSGRTLMLSDRDIAYKYAGTVENYESYLLDTADLPAQISGLNTSKNTPITLKCINDPYAGHDHLIELHDSDSFLSRRVKIYEIRLAAANETFADDVKSLLWSGYTEQIRDITKSAFNITCSSRLFHLRDALGIAKVSLDDFPGADPDDVGKTRNMIFGDVEHVPCRAIKAGVVDSLAADITSSATTIYISGASIAEFPTADFTIQIDAEKIRISSRSENTLTASARGYDSTTATAHDKGAGIAEVMTEYIYEIAQHPVHSIGSVFVDDIRQTSGYTAYTGQAGDELAGYPGTAVVKFTALPTITQQVNLEVEDGIGVNDDISISKGSHNHAGDDAIFILTFENGTTYAGTPAFPECVTDSDFSTYGQLDSTNDKIQVQQGYYESPTGYPKYMRLCTFNGHIDSGAAYKFTYAGVSMTMTSADDHTTKKGSWVAIAPGVSNVWDYFNSQNGLLENIAPGTCKVGEVWVEFLYGVNDVNSEATGVDRTGAVTKTGTVTLVGNSSANTVIGRLVTVNVEGYQDDGNGTYTGTPNALIERPDHIFKYLLCGILGEPAADIGSSFATSGAQYASAITGGYKFAGIINEISEKADILMNVLAYECRSDFYDSQGKFELVFCPDTVASADNTIAQDQIVLEPIYALSDVSEVKNQLHGYYRRDYRKAGNLGQKYMDMLENSAGPADKPADIELKAVRLSAMAENVLAWLLNQKKDIKKTVTLTADRTLTDLSPASTFTIAGGLYASKIFKILQQKINKTDRTILISAREVGTLP